MSWFGILAIAALATAVAMRSRGSTFSLASAAPVAMIVAGGLLTLRGRPVLGLPLVLGGVALWFGRRGGAGSGPRTSEVVTDWLRMTLDHDTGDMDGHVLRGAFGGTRLSALDEVALRDLAAELAAGADRETLDLFEAYLDRRAPGWRDGADGDEGAGLGAAPGPRAMGEKEAYQVLGLAPGASEAEIREAHRRLMKRAHPDAGGSPELAARLNEARDVLLRAH